MKSTTVTILLLIALLAIIVTCSCNRMKTDEKKLANQILTEEEQLEQQEAKRAEREKQLADSIAKLPKGFRFNEDRKIDQQNPPIVIDIIGNRTNPEMVKLSQLFKKIEYIRLETVTDSSLNIADFSQIVVGDKHIYGFSLQTGVVQFRLDGKFIGFICKNDIPVSQTPRGSRIYRTYDPATKMVEQMFYANGNLCFKYRDKANQTTSYYQFDDKTDCSETLALPTQEVEKTENKSQGSLYAQFSDKSVLKTTTLYPLPGGMTALVQNSKPVSEALPFISVLSTKGDTICSFRDCDPVRNFSKSTYRGVDNGNSYYLNGSLFIRQSFNDTIYQLVPPNRLIPRYILSFGTLGIRSAQEGIDPGVSLKEKLVPETFLETSRYLFISYSKDYDCPATAKQGTLKYSRLVYDKKSGTLTPVYIDEAPFIPHGKMAWPQAPELNIENDLDKMPFKWPESVTAGGQPFLKFWGEELLKQINHQDFPLKNIKKSDQIIAIYF